MSLIKPFTGPGSTPSRRRFWDKVTDTVNASRKIAGRYVTVSEHKGKGTLINVADTSARRAVGGICPETMTATFSDIVVDCGCQLPPIESVNYVNVTDIAVNQDFTSDTPEDCHFFFFDPDPPQIAHVLARCDSNTCDGFCADDFDDTQGLQIFFVDGVWRIWYQTFILLNAFLFYYKAAGSIGSPPTGVTNQITTCGDRPWDSDPDFATLFGSPAADVYAVGHGGTIIITP